ncbi:unnamed protein product [Adineta ricciae]|uniref:Uncharacterized protein n=1 Tax=Adineta ricciae TaxID=249248 RepID=A0A814KF74_ADIRI|nr:unnamed protein product [Adineta ricciae]CAF1315456.1 unnamed protein product [Adineta ricciae]
MSETLRSTLTRQPESLAIGKDGSLYVSDAESYSAKRWRQGETAGTIVAGGRGSGSRLDQLHNPTFIWVDDNYSLYIKDKENNRIVEWGKDTTDGPVLTDANKHTIGKVFTGIAKDHLGQLYVSDWWNRRILHVGAEGDAREKVVINDNGKGRWLGYVNNLTDLFFDRQGNYRVQKFKIDLDQKL